MAAASLLTGAVRRTCQARVYSKQCFASVRMPHVATYNPKVQPIPFELVRGPSSVMGTLSSIPKILA